MVTAHPSMCNEHLIACLSLLLAVAVIAMTGVLENTEEITAKFP